MRVLLGVAAILALARTLGEDRRRPPPWRTVAGGLALRWALTLLLDAVPATRALLPPADRAAGTLRRATAAGTLATCLSGAVVGLVG